MEMRKPAYSLIELLAAVSVFVLISVLATSTVIAQSRAHRSQLADQLMGTALSQLNQEFTRVIARAGNDAHAMIVRPITGSSDQLLLVKKELEDGLGATVSGLYQHFVYCPEVQSDGRIFLVRFEFIGNPTLPPASTPTGCTVSQIAGYFGLADSDLVATYPFPQSVVVTSFQVNPLWSTTVSPALYDEWVQAVRVTLQVKQQPASASDARASLEQESAPPITLRALYQRDTSNFSNGAL